MQARRSISGFTLVELAVVIAVIAVLVTIGTFAYSGWRTSIAEKDVKNDLKAAASSMENYRNFNDGYPLTIPSSFRSSPNVTTTGSGSADGANFCLNAVSKTVTSVRYYMRDSMGDPKPGSC